MKNIKTGVDRLVEFIAEKKRIKLVDAAKELGVGTNVVQEWAEFLEQEGLITIDYTFSTAWLEEKKISKEDVMSSAKEYSSQKDAFVRKIDVALKSLDTDTVGFEDIRRHFLDIQSRIRNEIDTVKKELDELQRYEELKKNLDKDIAQQRHDYDTIIARYSDDLKSLEQQYNGLVQEVEKEAKNTAGFRGKIEELRTLKSESEKIIAMSKNSLRDIEKALSEGNGEIGQSEKRLDELNKFAEKITQDINEVKSKSINAALKVIETKAGSTANQLDSLFKNVQEKTEKFGNYAATERKIYDSFKGYFIKNIETEKLISQIEAEKSDMLKELESLKSRAIALTIISKDKDIRDQLRDIDDTMKNYYEKKQGLSVKIDKLIELIKGNNL